MQRDGLLRTFLLLIIIAIFGSFLIVFLLWYRRRSKPLAVKNVRAVISGTGDVTSGLGLDLVALEDVPGLEGGTLGGVADQRVALEQTWKDIMRDLCHLA